MADFYEFFAGGGMARAGLGNGWTCTFANDFSPMKANIYRENWGDGHFNEGDIAAVKTSDLPGHPALCWASTPCQDLSLAGNAVGLGTAEGKLTRSGAFWPWFALMQKLAADGRKPAVIVFENVVGALSSNSGEDFEIVSRAFVEAGYAFGAMQIDARMFLPQSRPRLFIVGYDKGQIIPSGVKMLGPQPPFHTTAIQAAYDRLPPELRESWVWWCLPQPLVRVPDFASLIEEEPTGTQWHTHAETKKLLASMSPANVDKLKQARAMGRKVVGTIYKRTRPLGKPTVKAGKKSQKKIVRAEVRFDGVAGCLRTPSGGSSRQTVIIVEGKKVRTRLLSTREAARLMGLPDTYKLPENYNDAYHIAGDGVAVPVVRFLSQYLLEPLVAASAVVGRTGEKKRSPRLRIAS